MSARRTLSLALLLTALLLPFHTTHAQEAVPTQVMVRALAHDAKIIGSGVGGARVVIQDAATGEVLAEGLHEGGTGDTRRIMVDPHVRGAARYDTEGTAGFRATLHLSEPTTVDVTAYGPLGTPHATTRTSKRLLLVPGKDVLGDGLVLELNGFTVELLDTPGAAPLDVRARVTMLCGCPTEPGGLWDADDIEITARLLRDGREVVATPLRFAGERSTYEGRLPEPGAGRYTLEVIASHPERANFGHVRRDVMLGK